MPPDRTDEGSRQLPGFEYVPPPIKVTLLKPVPRPDGGIRYLEATEDDLAEVFLSLGDEGMQRVGHLIQKKLREAKKDDGETPPGD